MGISAIVVKPKGFRNKIHHKLKGLLMQQNKFVVNKVLKSYDTKDAHLVSSFLDDLKVESYTLSNSPRVGTPGWEGSFWDVCYKDLKDEYYYDNYIRNFYGGYIVFILKSKLEQELHSKATILIKGSTTLVMPNHPKHIIRKGRGFRGLYTVKGVQMTRELIDILLTKNPSKGCKEYLIRISKKNLLFPSVSDDYKNELYQLLPKRLKNSLNSHRIHSIDTVEELQLCMTSINKPISY